MAYVQEAFEQADLAGMTAHYNSTVTTIAVAVPSSAVKVISEVLIQNTSASSNINLLVSFDGGTTFKTIRPEGSIIWSLKGNLKQFRVKSSTGTASYEAIVNFEAY